MDVIKEEKKEAPKVQKEVPKKAEKGQQKMPLPFQTGKKYGIFEAEQEQTEEDEDDRETEAENRNLKNLPTAFSKKKQALDNRKSTDSNEEPMMARQP